MARAVRPLWASLAIALAIAIAVADDRVLIAPDCVADNVAAFAALTINGGPSDQTKGILQELKNANAKAVFFFDRKGMSSPKYDDVVKSAANDGHIVACRADHEEQAACQQQIESITGKRPRYRRPVGTADGASFSVETRTASEANQTIILWNLDLSQYPSTATASDAVLEAFRNRYFSVDGTLARNGSFIIVLDNNQDLLATFQIQGGNKGPRTIVSAISYYAAMMDFHIVDMQTCTGEYPWLASVPAGRTGANSPSSSDVSSWSTWAIVVGVILGFMILACVLYGRARSRLHKNAQRQRDNLEAMHDETVFVAGDRGDFEQSVPDGDSDSAVGIHQATIRPDRKKRRPTRKKDFRDLPHYEIAVDPHGRRRASSRRATTGNIGNRTGSKTKPANRPARVFDDDDDNDNQLAVRPKRMHRRPVTFDFTTSPVARRKTGRDAVQLPFQPFDYGSGAAHPASPGPEPQPSGWTARWRAATRRMPTGDSVNDDSNLDADFEEPDFTPGPVTSVVFKNDLSNRLPPNWTEHVDPGSGHTYFWNSLTNASTWNRPTR
ncbi:hypothetical protein PBRA_003397 [Plasmodiophora brassicae]|nr:hypothetical protein PBRA_003397 [Plasmodiophora brassicae]